MKSGHFDHLAPFSYLGHVGASLDMWTWPMGHFRNFDILNNLTNFGHIELDNFDQVGAIWQVMSLLVIMTTCNHSQAWTMWTIWGHFRNLIILNHLTSFGRVELLTT